MKINEEIITFQDKDDLFHFAADDFKQRAIAAIKQKKYFTVALPGGNTPKLFFDTLAQMKDTTIPWEQIKFFFGDERYVPHDSVQSNYHTAYQHLFSKVPVCKENIYPIPTQFNDPIDAAKAYEHTLRTAFHLDDHDHTVPQFDLFYLGLGEDAHTASLMPFTDIVKYYAKKPLVKKDDALVAALFVPELNGHRVTLTPTIINHANHIIFLVTGDNKADAVRETLKGENNPLHYPAQLIASKYGKTIWYLDKAAALKLNSNIEA